MRSFSLPKVEALLSFMTRSYMLAVRLLRVNWTVTWMSPRSFSFFPVLELSRYHLQQKTIHVHEEDHGSLLQYVFGHYPNALWGAISFAEFSRLWAESAALYPSAFILLLLSAVVSSINTSDPVTLAGEEKVLVKSATTAACFICLCWILILILIHALALSTTSHRKLSSNN